MALIPTLVQDKPLKPASIQRVTIYMLQGKETKMSRESLQTDITKVRSDFERDSTIVVPEVTLVRDSEVFIATQVEPIEPALPWLKQRRTIFLIGALVVIVIASSIAFALHPKEDGNTEAPEAQDIFVVNSPVPSFSMAPSSIDLSPGATCQMDPDCGATLETWRGIGGFTILDLMSGTNNFTNTPNRTAHLGSLLEAPPITDDYNGIHMKGWLMPPVSGVYAFWIASDDWEELSLSSDDHPENKVHECFVPWFTGVREWNKFQEHESPSIQLEAGKAYYFEVNLCGVAFCMF
jgi:hypothetical protein